MTNKTDVNAEIRLNDKDVKKISEWFNKKSKKAISCQVCGHKSWFPHPFMFTAVLFNLKKNKHEHGKFYPTVMVECHNCANYLYFSALNIGIDHEKYLPKKDQG